MPASQPPLVAAHSSFSMNWPIVGIAVVGILTTSVFLLAYYVFVIKCCLNWRRSDFLLRLFSASRRYPFPSNLPTESSGLDPSTIRAIPTFIYPGIPSAAECAVCLSEFRGGERLRLLPGCSHAFHIDCIDTWLQSNASCPLCRAHITDSSPPPADNHVIATQSSVTEAADGAAGDPRRKLEHTVSMGDECIEPSRENKEELFPVQPLRRSLSTNSSCHRQLYISVQEILRLNPDLLCGEGSSSGGRGSGRLRRSFFPFAYGRNAMRAVESVGMNV